jgi:capsular exopolysaccharide synthesis family protein
MNIQPSRRSGPERQAPAIAGSGQGIDIQTLLDLLGRRWLLIVGCTVFVTVAFIAVALLLTPKYDAHVRLKINPSQRPQTAFDQSDTAQPDSAVVDTEVSIMRSRDLAVAVAKRLNLAADPLFNRSVKATPAGTGGSAPIPDDLINGLQKDLSVSREGNTYLVDVGFQSTDPQRAVQIANTFADEYLQASIDRRTGTAARQAKWLDDRLATLGGQVQQADAEVARYRASAGIVQGGTNGTITDQQVAPLASQLATTEAQAAAARSNLAAARQQVAQGGIDGVSSVLNSPVIADLRRQRTEVLRQQAEIAAKYGPKHPESIRVNDQLAGIDKAIKDESNRILSGLQADAQAADASASSLRAGLSSLRARQAGDTRAAVTADSLQREADAKRTVYQQLAQAAQQTNQEQRSSEPQGAIVDAASAPDRPTSPKKTLFAVLGAILGMLLGLGTTFLIELLSTGVRTVDDVEKGLGVPFLASLPLLPSSRLKMEDGHLLTPAGYVVAKPMSTYAEALRTVRSSLALGREQRPKIISIASAVPGEGKTSTAAALARVMALSGDRVILVDCDLRRSGLGSLVQEPPEAGVLEVLTGKAELGAAIKPDVVPGLDLLLLAKSSFTPQDLFSGPEMAALLQALADRYDAVILDTPPILAVSDARTIVGLSDATVLVIHWQHTPRRAVKSALSLLEQDGATVSGAVLSMTNPGGRALGADNPAYYYSMYRQYHEV